MQGLLVDKILLLKYLSISQKTGLDQRGIITTARSAIFFEFIHAYPMLIGRGIPCAEKVCKVSQT